MGKSKNLRLHDAPIVAFLNALPHDAREDLIVAYKTAITPQQLPPPSTTADYIAEFEALSPEAEYAFIKAATLDHDKPIELKHPHYDTFKRMPHCMNHHLDGTLTIKSEAASVLFFHSMKTMASRVLQSSEPSTPPKLRPFIFNSLYFTKSELQTLTNNPLHHNKRYIETVFSPDNTDPDKTTARKSCIRHLSQSNSGNLLIYCTTQNEARKLAQHLKIAQPTLKKNHGQGVLTVKQVDIATTLAKLKTPNSSAKNPERYCISNADYIASTRCFALTQTPSLSK